MLFYFIFGSTRKRTNCRWCDQLHFPSCRSGPFEQSEPDHRTTRKQNTLSRTRRTSSNQSQVNLQQKEQNQQCCSSFQHHDLFKRTIHLTKSYQRENSMITDRIRSQGKFFSSLRKPLTDSSSRRCIYMLGVFMCQYDENFMPESSSTVSSVGYDW